MNPLAQLCPDDRRDVCLDCGRVLPDVYREATLMPGSTILWRQTRCVRCGFFAGFRRTTLVQERPWKVPVLRPTKADDVPEDFRRGFEEHLRNNPPVEREAQP